MRDAQGLATRPYREVRDEWLKWNEVAEGEPHGLLTGLFLPAARNLASVLPEADARACLSDLALAAAAYRAKNGRYPDRPEDLVPDFVPAVPIDPCDGRPLRMRAVGEELLLYSVGRDGRDDGGAERDYRQGFEGDITFCLGPGLWRERRSRKS